MQRTHTRSAARNHPARMPMSFVAGLGILLMAGTGFPSAGLAQSQPSLGTNSRGTAMPREGMPLARAARPHSGSAGGPPSTAPAGLAAERLAQRRRRREQWRRQRRPAVGSGTADLQGMLIGAALPCLNPRGALESGTTVRS